MEKDEPGGPRRNAPRRAAGIAAIFVLRASPANTGTAEKSSRLPPFYWAAFVSSGDWR